MSGSAFEKILNTEIGLNAQAIGAYAIARVVADRMAAHRLTDEADYLAMLSGSPGELQELVETVVVPETWFFRNPAAFGEMVGDAVAQAVTREGDGVFRALSIPCSTGEEPYSMAMALLDSGFLPHRFRIDAVDISTRTLAFAASASYGQNSFRGAGFDFRARHFDASELGYTLHSVVREAVNFAQGNLLAPDFLLDAKPYDVIFCRNLLVYFDARSQALAIAALRRLLRPSGVLCVGPGEAGLMLGHGFAWSKVPLAFAFRKRALPSPLAAAAPVVPASVARRQAPAFEQRAAPAFERYAAPAVEPQPRAAATVSFETAVRLADLGRLADAAQACDALIRSEGPSSVVFELRGLICGADGNLPDAADYFRKALYLDPNSAEALVHLALLLERGEDAAGARLLRARLGRLQSHGPRGAT